jgi:hypothetical protein
LHPINIHLAILSLIVKVVDLNHYLCSVWMEGNEGGVEGKGRGLITLFGSSFFFLNGRGKDLRGFEGVRYPSKPLISNSPKLESFGGRGD